MLTPSQDQIMGQLRMLLPSIGMLLAAMGYGTATENATLVTSILQVIGPAMILGGMIWSLIANARSSIMKSAMANLQDATPIEKSQVVASVSQLDEVKSIKLEPTAPAASVIEANTPSNVVT